ncbi:hypothetical protein GOODEAATRI_005495 [Goodea atripinnis]|uniref:Uncharacterized protein n=1 Tax=Goodea atripinnis TaxID=208336 RepID=A0ABV0P4J8_9TELE
MAGASVFDTRPTKINLFKYCVQAPQNFRYVFNFYLLVCLCLFCGGKNTWDNTIEVCRRNKLGSYLNFTFCIFKQKSINDSCFWFFIAGFRRECRLLETCMDPNPSHLSVLSVPLPHRRLSGRPVLLLPA